MKAGKISENILKRSVMTQLHSKRHETVSGVTSGEDCSELGISVTGGSEVRIFSSVNTVTSMDGCCIEELSVDRTVNDIACMGAVPSEVLLSLVLPEDTEESELRAIISRADGKCREAGAQITGCDIEVSENVLRPVISTTGTGIICSQIPVGKKAVPGDDIVMTKRAALSGTSVIAKAYENELLNRFSKSFIETAQKFDELFSVAPEAAVAARSGADMMHDASAGGIFGALWELAERSGVGLEIDLRSVLLRQETVEICNYLDISPYELMSDGSLLIACSNGHDLVRELKRCRIEASVIGKAMDGNDRCVINEEERRFLEPPKQDAIYMTEKIKQKGI